MYYKKINDTEYILRFAQGEEMLSKLEEFLEKESITNASFTGLGSLENPTLAHYKVDTKKYSEKELPGVFELLNITGNVALFENKPLIHSHATLSNENMEGFGGHLVKSTVSATVEITLWKLDSNITKSFNEEIGLKLLDLDNTL